MSARNPRGGMQQNVATALGYSAAKRSSPESVSCATCGSPKEFPTDAIGRVLEVCPRGCSERQLSPNGGDPFEVERARRQLDEARAENKSLEDKLRARFGTDICALATCTAPFTKKSRTQRFCSQTCASRHVSLQRGTGPRSLGILGGPR